MNINSFLVPIAIQYLLGVMRVNPAKFAEYQAGKAVEVYRHTFGSEDDSILIRKNNVPQTQL